MLREDVGNARLAVAASGEVKLKPELSILVLKSAAKVELNRMGGADRLISSRGRGGGGRYPLEGGLWNRLDSRYDYYLTGYTLTNYGHMLSLYKVIIMMNLYLLQRSVHGELVKGLYVIPHWLSRRRTTPSLLLCPHTLAELFLIPPPIPDLH